MRAVLLALLLAGCASAPPPAPPVVTITGPQFTRGQFECGAEPLPPNPAKATGRDAARYEVGLAGWGRGCRDRLGAVGRALDGAGQVVRP